MTEKKGLKRTVRAIFFFLSEMSDIRGNELPKLSSFPSVSYARFLQKIHSLEAAPTADSCTWPPPSGRRSPLPCIENTGLKRTARAILLFLKEIGEICGNELTGISSLSSATYVRFRPQAHSRLRTLCPRNCGLRPGCCETLLYPRLRESNTLQTAVPAGQCHPALPAGPRSNFGPPLGAGVRARCRALRLSRTLDGTASGFPEASLVAGRSRRAPAARAYLGLQRLVRL